MGPFKALLLAAAISFALTANAQKGEQPMQCDVGPLKETYGNNLWHVFSCEDEKTLVFLSDSTSPASPFYFMLFPENERYRLYGEGNGEKSATNAAHLELKELGPTEIKALIAATKEIKPEAATE